MWNQCATCRYCATDYKWCPVCQSMARHPWWKVTAELEAQYQTEMDELDRVWEAIRYDPDYDGY